MSLLPNETRSFSWDEDHCYAGDFVLSCDDETEARAEFALRTHLNDWVNEVREFKGDFWIAGKFYTVTGDIEYLIRDRIWADVLHPLEDSDPALFYAVDPDKYIYARIRWDGYAKILGKKVTEVENHFVIEELE